MSVSFIFANKNSQLYIPRNSSKYIFRHQIAQPGFFLRALQ